MLGLTDASGWASGPVLDAGLGKSMDSGVNLSLNPGEILNLIPGKDPGTGLDPGSNSSLASIYL